MCVYIYTHTYIYTYIFSDGPSALDSNLAG